MVLKNPSSRANLVIYAVSPFPHYESLFSALHILPLTLYSCYHTHSHTSYPWKRDSSSTKSIRGNIIAFVELCIKAFRADYVIICGWQSLSFIVVIFLRLLAFRPYSIWLDIPRSSKSNLIFSCLKKLFLARASRVLVTGNNGVRIIHNRFNIPFNRLVNFPYLASYPDSIRMQNINEIRNRDILAGDNIRVIIASRFITRKGHHYLIQLFKILFHEYNILHHFTFSFLGDGPELSSFISVLSDFPNQFKFYGWTEHDKYIDVLDQSDILLHPSEYEPYGIPPLDAMARGKCTICSEGVMSGLDRIEHTINGYLYPYDNMHILSSILRDLDINRHLIYESGANAVLTASIYNTEYVTMCISKILSLS